MSPSLPALSGPDVVAALAKGGFVRVSQRGSHVKMRTAGRVAIVPMHRELAQGTLSSILRQAGLSREELSAILVTENEQRGAEWPIPMFRRGCLLPQRG